MDWKSKRIRAVLEHALVEDRAVEDITTALTVDRKLRATGTIVARQACVIAGIGCIPAILEVFRDLEAKADRPASRFTVVSHPEIFDGVKVKKGQPIAVIRSNAVGLLSTERVMLNLLERMSGIATLTQEFVRAVAGTGTRIVDTRKTVPGLRALEKYAVCCGGGLNHRLNLEEGISIKDNHIALAGGIGGAVEKALKFRRSRQFVQVEVRSAQDVDEAIAAGAESFLLVGMTPAAVKKAVKQVKAALPGVPVEASGEITLANVKEYAAAGVDFVAVNALTSGSLGVDFGMKIALDAS
jgi:nicotinate-nucleotide pyrophosphorylase (carboxylating)